MDDVTELTTPRLRLARFEEGDLDLLARMFSDPDVARYIGGVRTRDDVATLLHERILDYYDKHPGLGIWKTIERETGDCIGYHLLNHIRGDAHIQVGYALFRSCWGRGYATEMCLEILRYGFRTLGLAQITAITDLPNVASQRVLLKCGLRRNGERCFQAYSNGAPVAWFERDAADWLREFPAPSAPASPAAAAPGSRGR